MGGIDGGAVYGDKTKACSFDSRYKVILFYADVLNLVEFNSKFK